MAEPLVSAGRDPALAWLGAPASPTAGRGAVAAVLLAAAVIYGPLVVYDPLLARDDHRLVDPLASVHTPAEWLAAVRSGAVLDVQPVRDVSFALDLWFSRHLPFSTFHLTNLVLFAALLALGCRLARRVAPAAAASSAGLALFVAVALHPVFANSVSWVSARKHLLAVDFALAATLVATSSTRLPARALGAAALFTLSAFSQPIATLWPAWLVLHAAMRERQSLARAAMLAAPSGAVMLLSLLVNYAYYTGTYVGAVGGAKFVSDEGTVAVSLLSLGRDVTNLLAPYWLATSYDPGSRANLVGLLLLVPLVALALKLLRGDAVVWLAFMAFPLALVTLRITNIFVSDTYLLLPLVGLGLLSLLALEHLQPRGRAVAALGLVAVAATFLVESAAVAASWRSSDALWQRAVEVSPTPNALARRSVLLLREGRADEALPLAERLDAWAPGHPECGLVLARSILESTTIPADAKLPTLLARRRHDGWYEYFLGVAFAQRGRPAEAFDSGREALRFGDQFQQDLPGVAASVVRWCAAAGRPDCAALDGELPRASRYWSEERFRALASPPASRPPLESPPQGP